MNFQITNASVNDLPMVYQLFEDAILFQKKNNYNGWLSYDKQYLISDVEKKLLFKIVNEEMIVCIFSICYADPVIWRNKEKGDALYLHRVVLNRDFKEVKLFPVVLQWAMDHAAQRKLGYIRMDTWAENEKLINYYKSYGFRFIENYTTPGNENLPVQHRNLAVALLEYKL